MEKCKKKNSLTPDEVKIQMKTQENKKKKRSKTKKSSRSLADNLSPVGGLLVFVGMVVYRNYLLSVNSSEAVMLHHYKRQLPVSIDEEKSRTEIHSSDIPAKLRAVHKNKNKAKDDGHLTEDDFFHFKSTGLKLSGDDKEPQTSENKIESNYTINKTTTPKIKKEIISTLVISMPSEQDKMLASMKMQRRYEDRRKLLVDKCGGQLRSTWNNSMQIIAAPDRKLAVCVVQKCGSTSWQKLVYRLRYPDKPWAKSGHLANHQHAIDLPWETKDFLMRSEDVTRVITVRHPFSRLVSGWHNKFYSEFAIKESFLQVMTSYVGRHEPEPGHDIAFCDFAQYIADTGLENVNVHFKSIEQLCYPCDFPYDYIVRAETTLEDLWYVLDKVNTTMESFRKHALVQPKDNMNQGKREEENPWKSEANIVKALFRTVPRETIEKLKEMYRTDFEKFGYTFDLNTLQMGDIVD